MSFWTGDRLIEATGGNLKGENFTATTVSTDTRSLKPGELFVALKGENFNGHRYLRVAKEAGAVAALVSEVPADAPENFPLIVVEDTLVSLQKMARYRREKTKARIIGITGSVGKTSAKEMLKIALSAYGETYATSGNYNNHIGLPITLCNLPESAEFAILEMGMNHAGEISFLSHIAQPQVALITSVEAVHLEFFDSVEGIARAKAEIFDGMKGGAVVLPADNPYFEILSQSAQAKECEILSFGESLESDFHLISPEVEYDVSGELRRFRLSTRGAHWPLAALGVLACVRALGLPLSKAEAALAQYHERAGRGEVLTLPWQGGQITLMDDAYNASPVSMKAALKTLSQLGEGRKLAILGQMLELGETSPQLHESLKEPIENFGIDAVVTIGEKMQPLAAVLSPPLHLAHFDEVETAMAAIETLVKPNDIVLCKGSHGSGVYRLVEKMKK